MGNAQFLDANGLHYYHNETRNFASFGAATAGTKGFRIKAFDRHSRYIYLTKEDVEYEEHTQVLDKDGKDRGDVGKQIATKTHKGDNFITGTAWDENDFLDTSWSLYTDAETFYYKVNDLFTFKTRSVDFDNVGKITEIHHNRIKYDSSLDAAIQDFIVYIGNNYNPTQEEGNSDSQDYKDRMFHYGINREDTNVDRYSFSVPTRPEKGELVVSRCDAAFGDESTIALGMYSFAGGRKTKTLGDTAFAFGNTVTAGYQSFAIGEAGTYANNRNWSIGYGCKNDGGQAFNAGYNNNIQKSGTYGFVGGASNTIKHSNCTVFGVANTTSADYQTIVGSYATVSANMLFAVGNGASTSSRSTAFTVWKDGHATLGNDTDTSNTKNVASIGYVAGYVKNLNLPPLYAVEEKQGSVVGSASCIVTSAPGFAFGEDAECHGQYGFSAGKGTKVTGQGGAAFGYFSEADKGQTVVGIYNTPIDGPTSTDNVNFKGGGALFIVGNGSNYAKKDDGSMGRITRNAFIVYTDGRAEIGADPENDMDVVPYKMHKEALDRIATLESQLEGLTTLLNQLNDGGIK